MQQETLNKSGKVTHTGSNCTVTVAWKDTLRLLGSAARFKIWTAKAKRRIGKMGFVFLSHLCSCVFFMFILFFSIYSEFSDGASIVSYSTAACNGEGRFIISTAPTDMLDL